ncbi:histone-lysine N-methyltransferase SETD1A-like [Pollicipes pollicipes]|uniref:histone-lysine N-methyltransferase SETD1A-like n=1 Tax=Pollicipes pollicipes TaxID=41117 RepID=UPI0018859F48|nr:histone-lysine N-methyltransferase SETD1A-like [Pollicipes pollicipes]
MGCGAAATPAGPDQPVEGGCSDDSDSSGEELQYGPGIVSRLKTRYLSMARGKEGVGRGALPRAVSLKDILKEEGAFERGAVQDSYVLAVRSVLNVPPAWGESIRKAKPAVGPEPGRREPVAGPTAEGGDGPAAAAHLSRVLPTAEGEGASGAQEPATGGAANAGPERSGKNGLEEGGWPGGGLTVNSPANGIPSNETEYSWETTATDPAVTSNSNISHASGKDNGTWSSEVTRGTNGTLPFLQNKQVGVIKPTLKPEPQEERDKRKNALNQAKSSTNDGIVVNVRPLRTNNIPKVLLEGNRAPKKDKATAVLSNNKSGIPLVHSSGLAGLKNANRVQPPSRISKQSVNSGTDSAQAANKRLSAATQPRGPSLTAQPQPAQTVGASQTSGVGSEPAQERSVAGQAPTAEPSLSSEPAPVPLRWHQRATKSTIYDFTERSDVPDHVENDGMDIHRRANPKPGDSGYVLLPGFDPGESCDDDDLILSLSRPREAPPPCLVTFLNAGVIINERSSLRQRSNGGTLSVSFSAGRPAVHQYPSEASLLAAEAPPVDPVPAPFFFEVPPPPAELPPPPGQTSNGGPAHQPERHLVSGAGDADDLSAPDGAGGLSTYIPSRLGSAAVSFELGVSRPPPPPAHPAPVPPTSPDTPLSVQHEENWSADINADMLF